MSAPYAGDVSPRDAYAAVAGAGNAVLVDVRTAAEWAYVGVPDLSAVERQVVFLEWQRYPSGETNADFVDELRRLGLHQGTSLYFLCRSGVRSRSAAAAATAADLGPAYNVLGGFEGPHDPGGHRVLSGWKNDGLPWKQG
jgi:rhodanese-related sulfurtransferase